MTAATGRRCPICSARVGDTDRACLTCRTPLPAPIQPASAAPPVQPASTQPASVQPASVQPASVQPAQPTPAQPQPQPQPQAADEPAATLEVRYGRSRTSIPLAGSEIAIGSGPAAQVRIKVAFLQPVHALLTRSREGWVLRPAADGAVVGQQDASLPSVTVTPGEVYRIGDRVGNFITVRLLAPRRRVLSGALRAMLPAPGMSFLIGSDPSCAVRLDHPLVQARHAAVRRDEAGVLWIEDRATAAGTYINGQRLRGRAMLSVGDIVQIGPFSAAIGGTALEPLAQLPGVDIDVRDASIVVPVKNAPAKLLLQHVNLHLEPASLTAVVGPSGAGKTTLMRMLSGQLAANYGAVLYNGVDLATCRQSYAELMGFVPQGDIVHNDLTVLEALGYQARLRLGSSLDAGQRAARTDQVITMLGLSDQAGQLVSSLSGGQRKRVSIGCELLKEPQVLFLDEPTSGLDPGLDKRMMLLLRLLADQGRTVLLTTHSIAHVDVCDNLILVGPGGHVMYAGPPDAAVDFFGVASLADVFSLTETPEAAGQAAARFQSEQLGAAATGTAGPSRPAPAAAPGPPTGSPAWRGALAAHTRIFAGRQLRLVARDKAALLFTLAQGVVVALLTALVAPSPFVWHLRGSSAVFVFGCAAVWFGMISSVRELVKERDIWRREFMAGGNLTAYLSAKFLVLALFGLVQSITLTIVLAATLGLPPTSPLGAPALAVVLTLWLANLAGVGLGLLVSATSPSADRALSLVPYLLIAQLVLCGVLFHLGGLTFVSWFMPARWSVSAFGGIAGLSSELLHQSSGLYPHSAGGLFGNWVALLALTAAALAGTAWSLTRQGRAWQTGLTSAPPVSRVLLAGLRGSAAARSTGRA